MRISLNYHMFFMFTCSSIVYARTSADKACVVQDSCAKIKSKFNIAQGEVEEMFIKRDLEKALIRYKKFPVIAVLGPRQSGKTTLVRHTFKKHVYLSLENPNLREFARTDPEGFLGQYANKHGIILDEFQYAPELLSYIQLIVDDNDRPGYFVLTGSQNFLMNQSIVQSLAGRIGILTLLPFSINELQQSDLLESRALDLIIKGGYPRIYTDSIAPADLYSSYIHTYVEKDVRQLINVGDLSTFQKFLSLCAGRIGQVLNMNDLATVCGISAPTAKKWLSILEDSYILFLLQPHFNNFKKRLVKSPKLYFYDTGLACSLLRIESTQTLVNGPFKGPLFENLIIADFFKQFYNVGKRPPLYFWRDANGRIEIDCIVDSGDKLTPVEMKASETISLSFFGPMKQWNEISDTHADNNYVVYAGSENQKRQAGHIVSWQKSGILMKKISA